ncbi:hypothetical protein CGCF415_v013704 [Colletotrichum fructicola]|nr:hypothetical protein CGCF415_v013704 [Colletotrichum fructicola]KAF4925929.1 hypothetical protein CGCF245_v013827 [Colletotrichum fructicola]
MFNTIRWSVWGQQIWALVGAVAALTTMAILLGKFNNRPVFNQMGVTLNAIISVLSVAVKAAVAFVLSECMAQWKWILYAREDRLMIDFDRLDGAARGPLGSLRVLSRTKGASIAQFGAILTIVALALDPFAQQLLRLREAIVYDKSNNDTSALISRAAEYSLGVAHTEKTHFTNLTWDWERNASITTAEFDFWNITTSIPPSMEGAIMSGFYKSPEELQRETLFRCSSGNCTFEPFVTLGVCHRCTDLSANLTRMPGNYDELLNTIKPYHTANTPGIIVNGSTMYATGFSLPNGHYIANTEGCQPYHRQKCNSESYTTTSFGTGNPNNTVTMTDIDTLLWSMSIIYADIKALNASGALKDLDPWSEEPQPPEVTWPNVSLKALECGLYYCAKRITSNVENGRLEETVAEIANTKRSEFSWDLPKNIYMNINDKYDRIPPEYRAPPDELRSLEFHKLWSVVTKNPLEIVKASKEDDWQMQSSRNQVTIQSESVKSISAYIQTLFRWEPWFNDTKVRAQLSRLEGMENAVGFNGASFGPVTSLYAAAQPPALNRLVSLSRSDFAGVSAVFESMAMSMTNEIRRTHEDADVARNGMNTMTYEGLVGSTVVLYEVKWQWIALHVTVLTLACTLMLMTIINTRSNVDVPLWKSSSLAALRRGNDIGGLLKDSGKSVADMEDAARKMYMSGRRIDVEETKYQGKQYSNLVESERAWQIDLSEGLAETSTTDTVEERFEPPSPASFHDQGLEMAPKTYSHTF